MFSKKKYKRSLFMALHVHPLPMHKNYSWRKRDVMPNSVENLPNWPFETEITAMDDRNVRSSDPSDYQDLPQSIGAMSKSFEDGFVIPFHEHERDQLLYAIRGIMRLNTEQEAWIVPPDRAVYIPGRTRHSVSMNGQVEMRTLYIASGAMKKQRRKLGVLAISGLLRELILALSEEIIDYTPDSRAGLIARLIDMELNIAHELSFQVPLPKDPRLQRLCAELLASPSDRRTLNEWAEVSGASVRTLARLFERDLGMSFNNWRQRARFHSALGAISLGEPVSRVAHEHGYRSASAFSAAFGRTMGFSPSAIAPTR